MQNLFQPDQPLIESARKAHLTLELLGPLQIAYRGQPLAFTYTKVPALLIYLAVESGREHRRSALADLLWPEQDEATARHNLSQALFTLRRAVQDDLRNPLLIATRDSVRLNPDASIWVDVVAFQHLVQDGRDSALAAEQAVTLYNGAFLEHFSLADSADFEEWITVVRERLHRQVCNLLERLTDAHLGDAMNSHEHARRWVAIDSLNEEAHRRLMSALARNGQRTAALAQFEQCRRVLHDELGIAPEPATIALYESLKQSVAPVVTRPAAPRRVMLPQPHTSLIGRGDDLAAMQSLLHKQTHRLVTICGPGGVGKTRLALQVAEANAATFADGVCFVSLAALREAAQVPVALSQAMDLQQTNAGSLLQQISAALAHRSLLLLLDNCEHLLPALATFVADLLAAAPRLVILATSRVALRLSYEQRYLLPPLSLERNDGSSETLSPAETLFIERAQAVRPALAFDYETISAICRRLDGLPLAIELAATRTRVLSPRDLLARLEQRLTLLSNAVHDLPERQQTLFATIDWSYQLLTPAQGAIARRLAVFTGGWTLAAAEAVCADLTSDLLAGTSVLDGIVSLLDASLINEELSAAGEPRCTMLETIHEYLHDQLVAHDEWEHVQGLHAHYLASLAAESFTAFSSLDQVMWLRRWDAEMDNLRSVLDWCCDHAIGLGLRLASDLHRFWDVRGHRREGRDWLERLLGRADQATALAPTTEERAYGLLIAGTTATFLRDFDTATRRLYESLALHQQLNDQHKIARILNSLGTAALHQCNYGEAEQHYQASLALRRSLKHTVGVAATLHNLALIALAQGDLARAKAYHDESLSLYQQIGDRVACGFVRSHIAYILLREGKYAEAQRIYETSRAVAQEFGDKPGLWLALHGLAELARIQQSYPEAKAYYQQSLAIAAEIHDSEDLARSLLGLATVTWVDQQTQTATTLLSAIDSLRRNVQITFDEDEIALFEQTLAEVQHAVDDLFTSPAWQRGQYLSIDHVVALALDGEL